MWGQLFMKSFLIGLLQRWLQVVCTTMGNRLQVYNVADIVPFFELFRKMAEQY